MKYRVFLFGVICALIVLSAPGLFSFIPGVEPAKEVDAATTTKTYTFDAGLESYSATCGTSTTCAHQASDGSPGNGSLEENLATKNKNNTWQWELSGITWESLGVTAGATVNTVDGSYNYAAPTFTAGATGAGDNTSGVLAIYDSAGTSLLATLESSVDITGTVTWTAQNAGGAIAIPGGSQASNTSIRVRMAGNIRTNNTTGATVILRQDQIALAIDYTAATHSITQNQYRFYQNTDSILPTTPLAGMNTRIGGIANTDVVRVRMNLTMTIGSISANDHGYTLEYASAGQGKTASACSAASGWTAIGAAGSGTIWRGYTNASVTDGTALSGDPPTGGDLLLSDSDVAGSYESTGNSSLNPFAISIGEDTEYDWVIQNNGAPASTYYCFRMVEAGGEPITVYTNYPRLAAKNNVSTFEQHQWLQVNASEVALTTEDATITGISQNDTLLMRLMFKDGGLPLSAAQMQLKYYNTYADLVADTNGKFVKLTGTGSVPGGDKWEWYDACTGTWCDHGNDVTVVRTSDHSPVVGLSFETEVQQGDVYMWDWTNTGSNTGPENNLSLKYIGVTEAGNYFFRQMIDGVLLPNSAMHYGTNKNVMVQIASAGTRPTVSSVSVNSGAASINLTEATTTNVVCTATVTDTEGFADITSVTAQLHRSGVAAGSTNDNNNHYTLTGDANCIPSGGSGNNETYTCTFPVQYYADPTDAGTYVAENWECLVTGSDSVGAGTGVGDTIEMNSLAALNVGSTIAHGSVSLGGNTGATNQNAVITNTGNINIDVQFSGTTMSCTVGDAIPVTNQKFGSTDVTYASLPNTLSGTPVEQNLNIAQRTDDATPSTQNSYWGLSAPSSGVGGTCSGTNTFTAVNDIGVD